MVPLSINCVTQTSPFVSLPICHSVSHLISASLKDSCSQRCDIFHSFTASLFMHYSRGILMNRCCAWPLFYFQRMLHVDRDTQSIVQKNECNELKHFFLFSRFSLCSVGRWGCTSSDEPKMLRRRQRVAWTVLGMVLVIWMGLPGSVSTTKRMYNIYWNATNPMFRIDTTDNVIDVNTGNLPWEYDQANIICPLYRKGTKVTDIEKYIIYNVSREEFESCQITSANPRVIALCDKPHDLIYFTITFRSFTPTPGGLEFRPGKDYYFISTSSRSDLNRKVGGRCSSNNMRVVFKVADQPSETTETSKLDAVAVNVPRQVSEPNVRRPSVSKLGGGADFLYPIRDVIEIDSNSVEHEKRSEEFDRAATNEVIKQASIMTSSGAELVSSQIIKPIALVSFAFTALWRRFNAA